MTYEGKKITGKPVHTILVGSNNVIEFFVEYQNPEDLFENDVADALIHMGVFDGVEQEF